MAKQFIWTAALAGCLFTSCQRNEADDALLTAAALGHTQTLQLLLEQGTDANVDASDGVTSALHFEQILPLQPVFEPSATKKQETRNKMPSTLEQKGGN